MIGDIFITSKGGRPDLFERSLDSFSRCTPRDLYRLTVVLDGWTADQLEIIEQYSNIIDHTLLHTQNIGLGPSINQALVHIDSLKRWDGEDATPLTIYCQDDIMYSENWLQRLSKMFFILEEQHKLGFASGIEGVEHAIRHDLGGGLLLKDWIRATSMLGRHQYWMSMWPISRIDPETGRERGRPNDGIGSSCDWWFLRNHPNSVCKTGRTNLVIPGLLKHIGFDRSTWLARELPESETDKRIIRGG